MLKKIGIYIILIFSLLQLNKSYGQDSVAITRLEFNTNEREYAPVFHKNNLVFCGDNFSNEAFTYVDKETNKQLSDIYTINLDSVGMPKLFSKELKTSFHDGPITFSKDGNTAYFTRSQRVKKELKNSTKVYNTLGVYKATFDGIKWSGITPCYFNSPDFNVGHPSLSSDGKRLYVVSDKPDGYGGIDIYYAEIVDGFAGSLVNVGSNINTESNEMFPYINDENVIYFSSDRDGGRGGLDLYFAKIFSDKIGVPSALDTTFNSPFDDFGIIYNENGTEGYFCSNRKGSDDIYNFSLVYPEFNNCQELVSELLCYEFYEEATHNADSVAMIYEWDFGDGNKERALETYHCYEKAGFYIVELNILDPLIDKNFVNEATYELEIESINQPQVKCLDSVSIGQDYIVEVSQGKWSDYIIVNYYIDYGDTTSIVKNSSLPHQYQYPGFKELKVLISGIDSASGELVTNCFYKNILVKSSAELIANVENVVINEQLEEEKKFFEKLSYSNFNAEKIAEYDESFYSLEVMNSPVSIKEDSSILKSYYNEVSEVYDDKTNSFSYVLGRSDNPFDFIEEFRKAHHLGFDKAIVKAFEDGQITIADLGIAYNEESGDVNIVLNNIQFQYDGYELDQSSKKELEKLIKFLQKNEEINIELSAHTDASRNVLMAKKIFAAKGLKYSKSAHDEMSSTYNQNLSDKRAKSVLDYLVSNGIDEKRLTSIGYGESKPIAKNTLSDGTDNPEGRAKNRRVEFTIIHRE